MHNFLSNSRWLQALARVLLVYRLRHQDIRRLLSILLLCSQLAAPVGCQQQFADPREQAYDDLCSTGYRALGRKDYEEAIVKYRQAIELFPNRRLAHENLGCA